MFPIGKIPFRREEEQEEEDEEEEESEMGDGGGGDDDEVEEAVHEEDRNRKLIIRVVYGQGQGLRAASASCNSSWLCCQADECGVDLGMAKKYHQRHKVCERHSKAPVVLVSGMRQRFCQQCSKFHEISRFDETKRSCRERLAGHNERRRKTNADQHSGSERQPQPSQGTSSSTEFQRP